MFENPILFGLLTGLIVTLVFFFVNKDRDKKNQDPGKNTKYLVVFGIVFIVGLIGKICYSSNTLDNIEEKVDKILGGSNFIGGSNSVSNSVSNGISNIETSAMPSASSGETPPF
tara:strand:- start:3059 stop:3400 length:342 start_codon:yes stop_codon:yes gene_type:complete